MVKREMREREMRDERQAGRCHFMYLREKTELSFHVGKLLRREDGLKLTHSGSAIDEERER